MRLMVAHDFSFLRSARWLLGHVVAVTAIIGFAALGLWQLDRLDQRRDLNARIEQRINQPAQPLTDVLDEVGSPEDAEYRRVSVTGVYSLDHEVILQAQSLNGVSGHHVLTPLTATDGISVIIDRGWVPLEATGPPVAEASPPPGEVTVTGIVRTTQTRGRFGPADPPEGAVSRVSRVDIARLAQQMPFDLAPVFVALTEQNPAQNGDLPLTLPLPETTEGSHLSYAVQWFVFATVVLVGYPILLVRTAGARRRSPPPPG